MIQQADQQLQQAQRRVRYDTDSGNASRNFLRFHGFFIRQNLTSFQSAGRLAGECGKTGKMLRGSGAFSVPALLCAAYGLKIMLSVMSLSFRAPHIVMVSLSCSAI